MEQINIKNFATEMEAEMTKNFLEAHGIKSFIKNEGVHSSGIPNDRNGVKLFVWQKDAEKAKELMEF